MIASSAPRHSSLDLIGVLSSAIALGFVALVLLKVLAYGIEIRWLFLQGGAQKLRRDYVRSYVRGTARTYEDDIAVGRPRPFTRTTDVDSSALSLRVVFGYLFKTPALILASSLVAIATVQFSVPAVSIVLASALSALVLVMLATALLNRLVMGPLDQFNPDLGGGRFGNATPFVRSPEDQGVLYPSASALGRYVLVLIVSSIGGFTAIYSVISHSVPAAFSEGQAIDPVRWLYFTATIASTVGFGDIHAVSNVGRLFVLMQLAGGTLLVTWAATSFFSEELPPRDDPRWADRDVDDP